MKYEITDEHRSIQEALRTFLTQECPEEYTKTIDNALQRVKRKVLQHQSGRQVLD